MTTFTSSIIYAAPSSLMAWAPITQLQICLLARACGLLWSLKLGPANKLSPGSCLRPMWERDNFAARSADRRLSPDAVHRLRKRPFAWSPKCGWQRTLAAGALPNQFPGTFYSCWPRQMPDFLPRSKAHWPGAKTSRCSLQITGNGFISRGSPSSGGCRPSRIASTMSGASSVSCRMRPR